MSDPRGSWPYRGQGRGDAEIEGAGRARPRALRPWRLRSGRAALLAVTVCAGLGAHAGGAAAQGNSFIQDDGTYRNLNAAFADARMEALRKFLEEWNKGRTDLPDKAELEPYFLAMQSPIECPFEGPRHDMRTVDLDAWAIMPETLAAELPIDTGGQLMLFGLLEGNVPALATKDLDLFDETLARGAFAMIGYAQTIALQEGASQIRTGHLWMALEAFRFMVDPFNPAICPLDPEPVPSQ